VTGGWTGLVDEASLAVTALGLLTAGLVLARTRMPLPALAVLLEMLTGAGLLRLAAAPTLTRALAAGGILLVRQVAALGLRGRPPLAALSPRLQNLLQRVQRRTTAR